MVVVRPDGEVAEQSPFSGKLITQFPSDRGGRRGEMKIDWERDTPRRSYGTERTPENPGPTNRDSTIPGSRRGAFQDDSGYAASRPESSTSNDSQETPEVKAGASMQDLADRLRSTREPSFSRGVPDGTENMLRKQRRDRDYGDKDDKSKPIGEQIATVIDHVIAKTEGEQSRERKVFKNAYDANPQEARSIEEWNKWLRTAIAVASEEIESEQLKLHVRDDNSIIHRTMNSVFGAISALPMLGDEFKEIMMNKVRRVVAPTLLKDPMEKLMARIAERVHWDGKNMAASPGFREFDSRTGRYVYGYQHDEIDGQEALAAFNAMPDVLKKLLTDRAVENEAYRQNYVNVVLPAARAQTLSLIARETVRLGGTIHKNIKKQFDQAIAEVEALTPEQMADAKFDQADIDSWKATFDNAMQSQPTLPGQTPVRMSGEKINEARQKIHEAMNLLEKLKSDRGIYGYVHEFGHQRETIPDELRLNADQKMVRHAWFESVAASQKKRSGSGDYIGNLWLSDNKRKIGEARAELTNQWMQHIENLGVPALKVLPTGETELIEDQTELDAISGAPGEFNVKQWVQAKFGQNAGKKIFIPSEAWEKYEAARHDRPIDFSLKDLGPVLGWVKHCLVDTTCRALLFHPAKLAGDLMAAPFHVADFAVQWIFRNPKDIFRLPSVMARAFFDLFRPKTWKELSVAKLGEYSELQREYDEEAPRHWITWGLDEIGERVIGPVGSVMAALTKEVDLATMGDIPIKRFFRRVAEQLADDRVLSGVERDRFTRGVIAEFGFETSDLSTLLNWLRGKHPSAASRTAGVVQRATLPFIGYVSTLMKRMTVDAVNKGVLGRGDLLAGERATGARLGFAMRPLVWGALVLAMHTALKGALGDDDDRESAVEPMQKFANVGSGVRSVGRINVGFDDDNEYWLSYKGYSHPSVAQMWMDVARGNASPKELFSEMQTLHPVATALAAGAGKEGAYQAQESAGSKIGRAIASLAVPQLARIGPDAAKIASIAAGNYDVPDRSKQSALQAVAQQLGLPVSQPPKITRKGGRQQYSPLLEAVKTFARVNVKPVAYSDVAGEIESQAHTLVNRVAKIDDLEQFKRSGRARVGSRVVTDEQVFLKELGLQSYGSVDQALEYLKSDAAKQDQDKLRQAIEALPSEWQRKVDAKAQFAIKNRRF